MREASETLKEAWVDILKLTQNQVNELTAQLTDVATTRDLLRRQLRDFREGDHHKETDELLDALRDTKMKQAELSFEVEEIKMKIKVAEKKLQERRRLQLEQQPPTQQQQRRPSGGFFSEDGVRRASGILLTPFR